MNYAGYRPTLRERFAAFLRRVAMRVDPLPDYSVPPFHLHVSPGAQSGSIRVIFEANSHGTVYVRTDPEQLRQLRAGDGIVVDYRPAT